MTHELDLTRVLVHFPGEYTRGFAVDQRYKADADVEFGGKIHRFEMDTGSERGQKIAERLQVYDGVSDTILWIVKTPERRESLLSKCTNENCYFGLYNELIQGVNQWVNIHRVTAELTGY